MLLATWWVASALLVLPHMSTGTIWSKLSTSLTLAASQAFPLGALGIWIVILGYRIWTGYSGLRKSLIITHGLLLLPGILASAVGVYAMRGAARSAAKGGGLLSPIAAYPLVIGVGVVLLATGSIVLALTVIPNRQNLR
jgi:hypothetical protein